MGGRAGSRVLGGVLLVLFALGCGQDPQARGVGDRDAADAPGPLVPKVLLIGIDGVRPDILASARTPHLDRLSRQGSFTERARTGFPSVSGPGWSSFLIGVWPEKHGVTDNEFQGKAYGRYPDVLTRVAALRPELTTYAAADWLPLVTEDHNGPVISDDVDRKFIVDGYDLGWAEADSTLVDDAVRTLSTEDPDLSFVYLGNPDEVSHATGAIGVAYVEALERADREVGRLMEAIRSRSTADREDWLVLVSTDHGRRVDGGHGGDSPEERTIFYLASGPSAIALPDSVYVVDVAVSALTHLGIAIDPSWELDGRPAGVTVGR
ncbi:MAG: DUF4983 domain-containing protein [Gemmatimonadetes bacterium]|nr:DUF4983 domain-containing protein [Gemmatimonadota bacterium]